MLKCAHATFVLKEICRYNKSKNKTTYVIAIDASKAFDRVNRNKLWNTMFEMNIRPALIIALKVYYENFYIIVVNGKNYAAPFITTVGVKQGGCISPDLYKLYSEIIVVLIRLLNYGIKYGTMNIDVLMYADDVVLVTSCPKEAQAMLDILSNVSESHQIKFNPDKTNVMILQPTTEDNKLVLLLCKQKITRTESIKYLGTELESSQLNKLHVEKRKKAVISSLNNLINSGIINDQMNMVNKIKLFKTYVKPLLTFGCEVLDLDDNDVNELSKAEGNALKRVIGITKKCHTTPLYAALSIESTKNIILKQQLKFILRAQDNEYLEEFLKQSRVLVNNEGMIGKIIIDQGWKHTVTLSELNECIKYKLEEISMNVIDSYFFNKEAQQVKGIFQIRNGFLRSYKLNELLHYSTYQKTNINEEILERMKSWSSRG